MKVEYINPFIKATTEVFKTMLNTDIATGKPYIKASPFATDALVIMVGITGEIRGQAAITMNTELAKNVASTMMMGMPVDELDELSKSALSELANMIMGNSATLLFNQGVNIDITPPTLMIGDNMQISAGSMRTICVPLECELGELMLDVSVKE
jgi:chemotaxis protein CheX